MSKISDKNMSYIGIDFFRLAAALLVIAIHTSPLESFNPTCDFILTRILARVAVPFFLMTSGFFMISRWTPNNDRLKKFVKKTALIYLAAILLYIPINIYNGYFQMENLLPNIIKDIVFDGTLYHLWYLPAAIIGAIIAWLLVKKLDYGKALVIAALLYLIGMFGDSYYKIAENSSFLAGFYKLIFQVSDYTRNGIFFAPVFMILGGLIADSRRRISFKKSITGFAVCFLLMLSEGLTLHHFNIQRHDSMYVFLIPCMYFLFNCLLNFRGRRLVLLKDLSLIMYIIHPCMIVAIRLFAKILHAESVLIENSLVHFLAVSISSAIFGIACEAVLTLIKRRNRSIFGKIGCFCALDTQCKTDRAYIEINLKNLEHNARVLQNAMPPGCRLMAVVKANAYGHGSFEIASALNKTGVRAFAAATVDEAVALRKCGIRGEILILGATDISRAGLLVKYDLIQSIIDFEYAEALNRLRLPIKVHIKIDTGMHRLGIPCEDVSSVSKIFSMENLNVCGIFTHLSCSESRRPDDIEFTNYQIDSFYNMIDDLESLGLTIPKIHIQSSYGLLNYPELQCDYVRAGVALYGVLSSPNDSTVLKLNLRPVLSLKSRIILIRSVSKGESIGYDRCFTAARDSRIAILPIGYGDGFPRNLSCGRAYVRIKSRLFPIIGRVCMDSLTVDITDGEDISVGDTAVLIGAGNSGGLSAPEVADSSDTITNELLSRMGCRLPIITASK